MYYCIMNMYSIFFVCCITALLYKLYNRRQCQLLQLLWSLWMFGHREKYDMDVDMIWTFPGAFTPGKSEGQTKIVCHIIAMSD